MQNRVLTAFLMTCLTALVTFAQNTNGRLVGTVSAPDGAIAGATVVVRDTQTGKERTVVASENGTFDVPQLEFGTYTVTITAAGYKTFVASDLKIDVGREYPLNAVLEVGQVSEQVTVVAGAEQINASNAELSTTISTEQVRELPINGRNPLSLLNLTAGANPLNGSINGQRTSATTVTRDGLNVQDNFIRSGTFVSDQPTVDDISEITITTQNAGVEQGAGASFVQLVTPRGGQKFHGNLYAFNRNSKFAANQFFNNATNVPRAFLNRNQFGGSLSGPVPLPGFNEGGPAFLKNKGFFFFNYEGFRLAQQATISGLTTLLPAAREGNFTYNRAVVQNGQTVLVPTTVNVLTGQGVNGGPGFTTPLTALQGGVLSIDPIIASRYLANLPTTANGPIVTGTNFIQSVNLLRADPLIRNSFTGRVDVDINDRHSFHGVYRRNNSTDARTDQAAGFSPTAYVTQGGPTNFFSMAYRTTISENFSNELRGGFQKSEPFFNESNVPSNFIISTAGGLGLTNPEGTFRSQGRNTKYRNIQDNAVYTWGNHSIRFGAGLDLYGFQSLNYANVTPTYTIATSGNVPLSAADRAITAEQICGASNCINATDLARLINLRYFLGGIVGAGSVTANLVSPEQGYGFGPSDQRLNYEIYSAYGADQWRVTPKLTLNFGVRYELFTPLNSPQALYLEPVVQNGDLAGSILNPNGFLDIVGTNTGERGNFFYADKDNFSPNVSFAYSPGFEDGIFGGIFGPSFVIRGGFSINYFNDEYTKASSTLSAGNAGLGAFAVNAVRPGTNSTALAASLSPLPAFDALPVFNTPPTLTLPPRSFAFNNQQAQFGSQLFGTDPNIQVPRVYQWNIGIQREIGFKTVFEARYVGNMSNDLIRTVDFNQTDVNNNGFGADVLRARTNLEINDAERARRLATCIAGGGTTTACTTLVNTQLPRSAAYNASLTGSIPLAVFPSLGNPNAILTNAGVLTNIQGGAAGAVAQTIIVNNLEGAVRFQPNPNIFVSEILMNAGRYNYHGAQFEIRRRFSNGFSFQANYTFSKTLTDVPGEDQNRQGEVQEFANPNLNYGRSDNDRTHVFNANFVYELPFGKGKSFFNQGGWVNAIFGGWQLSSIFNFASGAPLAIIDPRGTESIAFQSGRQSATSTLSADEIKKLTGIFDTPNGIYFINPSVLNATITNAATGEVRQGFDLNQQLPAGFTLTRVRAASPIGTAPFPGQVFFFNNVGGTPVNGNLPRNFLNGTPYFNWDAGLSKSFRFTESMRLQLRAEAFNVLNRTNVNQSLDLKINSDSFGRISSTNLTPRILQFGARFDF